MKTIALLAALAATTVTLPRRQGVDAIATDLRSQLQFLLSNATLMRVGFGYALTRGSAGVNGAIEVDPVEQPNGTSDDLLWLDLFPSAAVDPRLFGVHVAGGTLPSPDAEWSAAGQQLEQVSFALPGRVNALPKLAARNALYGHVLPGVDMKATVDPDGVLYEFTTHGRDAFRSLVLEFDANVELRGDGSMRLYNGTQSIVVEPVQFSVGEAKAVFRGPHRIGFESKFDDREMTISLTLERPIDFHPGAARYLLRGGGDDVVTDAAGNIYVAGPANVRMGDTAPAMPGTGDFFAARLNPDGSTAWVTFGGGSGAEEGPFRVAALRDGRVVVAGTTASSDFPGPHPHGGRDAFVAFFDGRDGRLIGAEMIGGSGDERVTSLATDGVNRVVIGGASNSADFPSAAPSGLHGFVAEVNGAATAVDGAVDAVALDREGAIYAAARTTGRVAAGAHDLTSMGTPKFLPRIVVTKLAPSRAAQWSAIVGASASPVQMLAGDFGDVYIGGSMGEGLPMVSETLQDRCRGGTDIFVEHLAADGATLVSSTYLGGKSDETLFRMAIDHDQNVYLTGATLSADFPTTGATKIKSLENKPGLFFAKLDRFGHALLRSTLIAVCDSAAVGEMAIGMSVDAKRNTWLAVQTHIPVLTLAPPATAGLAVAGAAVLKIAPCIGCREAPVIVSVKPQEKNLRISGSAFDEGAHVFVDTKAAEGATWIDNETMQLPLSPELPRRFLLQVINGDNQGASYEVALEGEPAGAARAQATAARRGPEPEPSKKHDFGPLLRNLKFISLLALIAVAVVFVFRRLLS